MKREKLVSLLIGSLLAFLVSFGGAACLVTGFDMAVDLGVVALCCALGAVICSVCFVLPLGLLPVSVMALTGGFLWQLGSLELSVQSLLFRLSRQYHQAYGWGIIRLNMYTSDDMEPTLWLAICFLGILTAMAVSWAVCRKKTALPGFFMGILPLAACLVATDLVPDTVWLYSLLFGLIMLLLTQTARRQDAVQGNRLAAVAALPVALGLLILFAAVPRDTYTGQDRAQKIADAVLGSDAVQTMSQLMGADTVTSQFSSDKTDLTTVGVRLSSQAEMMQVTADYSGVLYLRGRAMDTYDGKRWQDSGVTDLPWPDTDQLEPMGEVQITTRYAHRMLYLPYYVQGVDLAETPTGIENTKKLTEYSFSCAELPDERLLRQNYATLENPEEYIVRTRAVDEWALPLLEEIPGALYGSTYDRAQAIADYVRNSAAYDTNTERMPISQEDFARWFLEESETGYCIHFATAATVLLQAAGIPARYVTGYMVPVEADVTAVVRLEDAHAWAEYYIPEFGWVVLEATPGVLTGEAQTQTTAQETEETQTATAPQTQPPAADVEENSDRPVALWWIVGILLLAALLWVQRRIRLHLRHQRYNRETANQQAITAWQRVVTLAALLGETPDKNLFELAQKAKYSQHIMQPEELQQFADYDAQACQKLNRRSVFHRFWYRVVLALY